VGGRREMKEKAAEVEEEWVIRVVGRVKRKV